MAKGYEKEEEEEEETNSRIEHIHTSQEQQEKIGCVLGFSIFSTKALRCYKGKHMETK